MKYTIHLLFLCLLFVASCTNEEDLPTPNNPDNDLSIRIHNISDYDFDELKIITGGGEHNYGNLVATGISDAAFFQYAYRYCYVELSINGDQFIIQPIDYVGETKIEEGEIIYEIDVIDFDNRSLSIRVQ